MWVEKYKKHHINRKIYIWNASKCSCENGKFLGYIIVDSVITCDENKGATKPILTVLLH